MNKALTIMVAMVCTMTASAQFVVYEPLYVPSTPRTNSTLSNSYSPFTVYEPLYSTPPAPRPQPKVHTMTLRGYYNKANEGWKCTPIKVAVTDEDIKLVSIKYGNQWVGCNSAVSEVSAFDAETIRDNFTFKAFFYMIGTVYF